MSAASDTRRAVKRFPVLLVVEAEKLWGDGEGGFTPLRIHQNIEARVDAGEWPEVSAPPSLRTIKNWVAEWERRKVAANGDAPWHISTAPVDEVLAVLPVIRHLAETGRTPAPVPYGWPSCRLAAVIHRLRRVHPELEVGEAHRVALRMLEVEGAEQATRDYEVMVAFAPWANADAMAAYLAGAERGPDPQRRAYRVQGFALGAWRREEQSNG